MFSPYFEQCTLKLGRLRFTLNARTYSTSHQLPLVPPNTLSPLSRAFLEGWTCGAFIYLALGFLAMAQ